MGTSCVSWLQVPTGEKRRPKAPVRSKPTHRHHFWIHLGWNCWEQIQDVNDGSQAPRKWADFMFHLACADRKILQVCGELRILTGALDQILGKQKPTQTDKQKTCQSVPSSNPVDLPMMKISYICGFFFFSTPINISYKITYLFI